MSARDTMVSRHLLARGVRDPRVLAAMSRVQREAFLPPELAEFAYQDTALPIAAGQTISQPYIVAVMAEALQLQPGDTVLEVGTGSGYAAAVLAEIAARVYTIERHAELADSARERLRALGYEHVEVRCGDGTLGWAENGPYQAIVVAAGGPEIPAPLVEQLAIGGRLVMPVGEPRTQELVRITRTGPDRFEREDLGGVRFVPLIGAAGWAEPGAPEGGVAPPRGVLPGRAGGPLRASTAASRRGLVAGLVAECAESMASIEDADLAPLLDRVGDAEVVLLGEATHGTSEFYRMRARISRALIVRRGFNAVAVEADWPDAAVVDRHVRAIPRSRPPWRPFQRFPTWMWRNRETAAFVDWLHAHNQQVAEAERRVSFSGLDLYSLYTSAYEVVRYLDRIDPALAEVARQRYGCLTPWQADPAMYGKAALTGRYHACQLDVVAMLRDLLARRLDYLARDGDAFFDATQNARVVADAERYYRVMYYGAAASWNLRDQHMFDCLGAILSHRGPGTKVIVWAHNSHVGNAAATEMGARGEHNLGQLCRQAFGDRSYAVGFGTDRGTVAAAEAWDAPMEVMKVRPAHAESYERLFHESGVPGFLLPLGHPRNPALTSELEDPRLERAIGVVYRPETEMASHYFQAVLPGQFDELVWFDESRAITPLVVGDEPW